MWKISDWICLFILIYIAIKDIQYRKVSVWVLQISFAGSVLFQLAEKNNIWSIGGGFIIGLLFLIVSKVTEEGMGYGDSFVILILGTFLGLWNVLIVLAITFFLLLCVSIPFMWIKKMSKTYTLPFLPFLAAGYLSFLLMGGINI